MTDISSLCYTTAKEAGLFLKNSFSRKISGAERKNDGSFSTDTDRECEKLIISKIKSVFPTHSIIAEESGILKSGSEYTWIIDPLDGTHNFMKSSHNFGVSIAVAKNGQLIIGAVYLPMFEEFYYAEINGGAMKNDKKFISKESSVEDSFIVVDADFKSDINKNISLISNISAKCFAIRIIGASSRELTYLAEGIVDGVIQFNDPVWDYAAPAVILREAGAKITSLTGQELTLDTKGFIASNQSIHSFLLTAINN
ncbi:MAG TPA: inositol monophosphatase [Spirochaetota bacterium]|nr:inositol monophosphatase [Spirochaetota bacterium]HQE58691.1 inositol monophosphatase [Spirochaetota bacterium]